jgi:hypothetical protein
MKPEDFIIKLNCMIIEKVDVQTKMVVFWFQLLKQLERQRLTSTINKTEINLFLDNLTNVLLLLYISLSIPEEKAICHKNFDNFIIVVHTSFDQSWQIFQFWVEIFILPFMEVDLKQTF